MLKTIVVILGIAVFLFSGCATLPVKEAFPTYKLNGVSYLPLVSLCESRNIAWDYDTFSRIVVLTKDTHKINLMVGDTLMLVDGIPQHLRNPVDIYQGTVVVPYKFKEQILDTLFNERIAPLRVEAPILKIKKVAIDAGHGGNDPGTMGKSGLREKDVNLDIAKRLAKLLEAEGIKVVLTRSTDKFIPLATRAQIANDVKADLFISIHSNANRVRALNGFEIYYISPEADDSRRAFSAAQTAIPDIDSKSFFYDSLDLKATLWDMLYTYNRAESIELAGSISKAVTKDLEAKILGIKAANFQVLREARMPAVLIEVGFLSNNNEERMLKNSFYRQRIAENIKEGIRNYAKDITLAFSQTKR